MPQPAPRSPRAGFTLVEMLVSVAILAVISLVIAQMVSTTAKITVNNTKHTDANDQARMVFDRMQDDFSRMVKRPDVDYIFDKVTGSSGGGANDTLYFYSEADGYFAKGLYKAGKTWLTTTGSTYNSYRSSISLIGYRINNDTTPSPDFSQMERLGKPLHWDSGPIYTSSLYPTPVVFLTYPSPPPTSASGLDLNPGTGNAYSAAYFNSTLAGAYSNEGSAPSAVGSQTGNFNDCYSASDSFNSAYYHVIGSQVFRFELAFQLRDGTQSGIPVMSSTAANGLPKSNLSASAPPLGSNDTSQGYAVGSRWYDTANQIGYLCLDPTANSAIWHEIGVQDISAIIITIAVMDNQGLVLLKNQGKLTTTMPQLQGQLADGANAAVAQTWLGALQPASAGGTVASATGLPQSIVSQIRVYQRFFYVNNL